MGGVSWEICVPKTGTGLLGAVEFALAHRRSEDDSYGIGDDEY